MSITNAQMLGFLTDEQIGQFIADLRYATKLLDAIYEQIVVSASTEEGSKVKPEESAYAQALVKFRSEIGTLFLKDLVWERYLRQGF